MAKAPKAVWTKRQTLAGLLSVAAGRAMASSRDGAHLWIADVARSLSGSGSKRLRLLIPAGSRANIAVLARHFTDLTDIRIEISEASEREIGTSLLVRRLQGRTDFDIVLPPTYEIPDLVASGAILSLDQIANRLPPNIAAPTALYRNGDTFDGQRYGYQTDGDVFLMFLNASLLQDDTLRDLYADRFGSPFGPPASWRDFDRQVLFVNETLDRPGAILFRTYGQIEWEFWLRFHAKGLWPLSPDFDPQFDTDIGQSALEDMIGLAPYVDAREDGGRSFAQGWRRFADSGAFATFGWGGTQKLFSRPSFDLRNTLTVAPLPGGSGSDTPISLPYFNWGWTYTVAQGTQDPELALAFILFAVSPDPSTRAVRQPNGFFDPFRAEHYQDETVRGIYGDGFLAVHEASLKTAIPDFYIANRGAYFETLGTWLKLALDGTVPPARALKSAADHWRLLTEAEGQPQQAGRWQHLRALYPDQIATRLRDLPN